MTALARVVGGVLHDTVTPITVPDERVIRWCTEGITQRKKDGSTYFLRGPLYNYIILRDGTVVPIAEDTKANHAGRINKGRFNALARGEEPPDGRPPKASNMTANSRLVGIALVRAYGEGATAEQMEALYPLCEKLQSKWLYTPKQNWAHGELTRRKIDPWPIATFAKQVRLNLRTRAGEAQNRNPDGPSVASSAEPDRFDDLVAGLRHLLSQFD